MSDYMPDIKSGKICETDGDFFDELFEMESQAIAEVKAELRKEKKEKASKENK